LIVYRGHERSASTRDLLASLCRTFRELESRTPSVGRVRGLLIEYGVLEAGLADALMGEIAMPSEEAECLRAAGVALGRVFATVVAGRDSAVAIKKFGRLLSELAMLLLPARIRISVPEGYAFYAVYPEGYVDAADRFAAERRPLRAVVIGIRSIGASLSAAVAGALEEHGCRVRSYTVRPAGHPWDRVLNTTDALNREWSEQRGAEFIIVDEGPGISGSSFASVAQKLSECGIPDEQISIFPSWDPAPERLRNETARCRWKKHRRYLGNVDEPWLKCGRDLSGGLWRELLHHPYDGDGADVPAVQPQHEARKFLSDAGVLLKFAGLGAYGERKLDRQRALAAAGFSPKPLGYSQGFLLTEFVAGRPLAASDLSAKLLDRMADYLAFRASAFPAERTLSFDALVDMIEINSREGLDRALPAKMFERMTAAFEARPAVEVDGRMMPHEWIETSDGYLKTDAVDHHADHFLPGDADIAWDLAGAIVEFEMNQADQQYLLEQYAERSGDHVPADLLSFYRIAYLAFRMGYATMAAEATSGTSDHDRFSAIRLGTAWLLQRELAGKSSHGRVRVPA